MRSAPINRFIRPAGPRPIKRIEQTRQAALLILGVSDEERLKKDDMILLKAALECPQCIVSVMGDHAGEDSDAIFNRKKADIERLGVTYWLMRSRKGVRE
jgi:hypothetical protein